MSENKLPTKIYVQNYDAEGRLQDIALTAETWQQSLLRGPCRSDFAPLWDESLRIQARQEEMLESLSTSVPQFRESCQKFIHDLRTFGGNKGSRDRLEGTGHEFYLGLPYFDGKTTDEILKLPTRLGTLEDDLKALSKKRQDGTMCAAHDLSPIFEFVFHIQWDKAGRKASLERLHSSGGLSFMAKEMAKKGVGILKGTFRGKPGKKR